MLRAAGYAGGASSHPNHIVTLNDAVIVIHRSTPISQGLVPHGLRHSHKTEMEEMGIPQRLQDDRMGHADGSVQARYSHITAKRRSLLDGLTERWNAALLARKALAPGSPVSVLDRLLRTL